MRTIHIDVKDNYINNVLSMLESIKGIMLNKIDVDAEQPIQIKKDESDLKTLKDAQADFMRSVWDNETDEAWNEL